MNAAPYILLVAANTPPKNTSESIQVHRFLTELDRHAQGRVVTVAPEGVIGRDASLELSLQHFDVHSLTLPLHRFALRVLLSRRLKRLHMPDGMFWLPWMVGAVQAKLPRRPDVIYSRSGPVSAALLARNLKRRLGVKWIMHLSDPWSENPDRLQGPRTERLEASCFHEADYVTLTTEGQAAYYRRKYPARADRILVAPNVMPPKGSDVGTASSMLRKDGRLHLVFAGNLYGGLSPEPLVRALQLVKAQRPDILSKLTIDFYGRIQPQLLAFMAEVPELISYHGHVPYAQAYAAQRDADVVLSIEGDRKEEPLTQMLLTKVTDCMALRKPILAIAPEGSETQRICERGFGWAVPPSQPQLLADWLIEWCGKVEQLRAQPGKEPPEEYAVETVVGELLAQIRRLMGNA